MSRNASFDFSRRGFLRSMVGGSLLWPGLVSQLLAAESARSGAVDPLAPKPAHHPAKARRGIFLYMSGGVSHVDSWDPKPKLFADSGKTVGVDEVQGRKGHFKKFAKKAQMEFCTHCP